MAFIFMLL